MTRINMIVLFCAMLLFFLNGLAQEGKVFPISKGEVVPNFSLQMLKGDGIENLNLYDIKKKLILLDIWGVNCSPCIKGMPHMLELQQKLQDDVQIILVTKNTRDEVETLWKKLKGHVSPAIIEAYRKLPSILGDSIITQSFPSNGIPTHVWIDSEYVLKAIAYSSSTKLGNMQAFIKGEDAHIDEKGLKKIDTDNPLAWLDKDTGFLDQLDYYSFLLSRVNHAGFGDRMVVAKRDSMTGKLIAFSSVNASLTDLYKLAFLKYKLPNSGIADNKIFLDVKDKSKFRWETDYSKFDSWADTSLYCFAIKVPTQKADSIHLLMQSTLDNFFHYKSRMETRSVPCLVLKRTSKDDKLKTKGKNSVAEMVVNRKGSFLVLKNLPMDELFAQLGSLVNFQDSFKPFFNETGYTQNVDITLPWNNDIDKVSLQDVKRALKEYGLDLIEECKELEMLVISDRK